MPRPMIPAFTALALAACTHTAPRQTARVPVQRLATLAPVASAAPTEPSTAPATPRAERTQPAQLAPTTPPAHRPPIEHLTQQWMRAACMVDAFSPSGHLVLRCESVYLLVDARTGVDVETLAWLPRALEPTGRSLDQPVNFLGEELLVRASDRWDRSRWRLGLYTVAGALRWSLSEGDAAEPLVFGDPSSPSLALVRDATSTNAARVERVDPRTGAPRWSTQLSLDELDVVAARAGGLLLVRASPRVTRPRHESTVTALDAETGAVRFRREFTDPSCDHALVDADAGAAVVACASRVELLNLDDGSTRATFTAPAGSPVRERLHASAALFDDALVVHWASGLVDGYARTGAFQQLWRRDELAADVMLRIDAGPLVRERGAVLHLLDPATGRTRWRTQGSVDGGARALVGPAGSPYELVLSLSGSVFGFARAAEAPREGALVVRGHVRVNGIPARRALVEFGTQRVRTDGAGRFRVETRTRGEIALMVDPESLAGVDRRRPCLVPRDTTAVFTHDGTPTARTHRFELRAHRYECDRSCDCR